MIFNRISSIFFLCFIFTAGAQAAPLTNGDFSSFDGWSGDKGDFFGGSVTTLNNEAELASDANFGNTNRATLTNDTTNFGVSLYQVFDLSAEATTFNFDYSWALSDALSDEISAVLLDPNTFSPVLNLFQDIDTSLNNTSGSLSVDRSSLVASQYRLEFNLIDGDINETDSLHIANITIENSSSVPVPPSFMLLLSGLISFIFLRKVKFSNRT